MSGQQLELIHHLQRQQQNAITLVIVGLVLTFLGWVVCR
jgi:hypothetical protein